MGVFVMVFRLFSRHAVGRWVCNSLLVATVVALSGLFLAGAAFAHEAKCAFCNLDVPQDTATQDNEVAIRAGRKRIEYRCAFCALSDAKTYRGDISILAPSEMHGKPVVISRTNGSWSVEPSGALFAAPKGKPAKCNVIYRAYSTRAAFDVAAKSKTGWESEPLTLEQLRELAK